MIDIHCHILPAADDGAKSLEESLAMAQAAVSSGVSTILATPHSNLPSMEEKHFVSFALRDRFVSLCLALKQAGIPLKILPGAEVLCTPELPDLLQQKKLLSLAGTSYFLAEFIFDESLAFMQSMLQIIRSHGYIPVVAHPERYDAIQKHPYAAGQWLEDGCVLQLNKGSILGELGSRAELTAHWLLGHGLAQIAASDAHDSTIRTTPLLELHSFLTQAYSRTNADLLLRSNPTRLLNGLPLQRVPSNL